MFLVPYPSLLPLAPVFPSGHPASSSDWETCLYHATDSIQEIILHVVHAEGAVLRDGWWVAAGRDGSPALSPSSGNHSAHRGEQG